MTEIDRWDVDGITFHLLMGDDDMNLDDDEDDLIPVKPFFTPEQLKTMDPSGTWRVALFYTPDAP